ncbi:transmembrane channel-like protein 7 isoform X2 [Dendroctonus ponderosae]|uniref:transmembrane channel-like protein 7 isoform X2 n=1 Tax=Dendroctonus ponderosae TaxID=77166 RepID=UPI0020363F78|nr:transmembrane channel-like protein 7 isoform X2 [Dendroctonus ponderosae]KAH1026264.1 hypothetical protein HUJ05_010808 [Dendroctonus ponderosae]
MPGHFQRPSLQANTYEEYTRPPKPAEGGGLKAAFQTRSTQSQNSSSRITPKQRSSSPKPPEGGLKRAFQARSVQPEVAPKPPGGLKAAFHSRTALKPEQPTSNDAPRFDLATSSADQPAFGGLKGAFFNRQINNPMDQPSTSATNASEYQNDVEYQESDDEEEFDAHHPSNYHSIHRLSDLNNRQGGNNLQKSFEARTGGTVRRNLGRNSQTDVLLEKHANVIVSKMEQDEALMEDSPDAEELRRTALRDMPQCLTIKRCVKDKLSKSVSRKSKRKALSCWKMMKYRASMSFTKLNMNIKDLAYSFELWYAPLKKIEGNFGTGVASFFKFLRWLFLVNFAIATICTSFIIIPKLTRRNETADSEDWKFADLITGEGHLSNTLMYYGFYTNETIGSNLSYSMPHAYFFTMLSIYFVSFAVIGISAAKSYRRSFIETEGGLKNVFANKIFCGWDYNIATKDAADLKIKAIYNELKELIGETKRHKKKSTFYDKFLVYAVQCCMNVVVLCLIMGTAAAVWYFLQNVTSDRGTRIIMAPIFVNGVMTLMPMFLSFIIRYEDYKNPKITLYLTLGRTFVLGAVTIAVIVTYWLQNDSKSPCWETSLAQEFYRMIVFDFFISVICSAVLDLLLFLFYKYVRKDVYLEFDIAWNTMQIIYNQTLFWVGLVFSPLLAVVVVVKLFLIWYIRYAIVMQLCKPSAKSWRAAQTSTWFLVMAFMSLMCIVGLVGYIVSYMPTSKECGPFRDYDHIYEIVTLGVLQLKANSTVWSVVLFITKPGVIAVALLFLCARVYYARAQANAQKEIVSQYRSMLRWSAKDKEYYYSLISQATKGQWQYQFHDKTINPELYAPDSQFYARDNGDQTGNYGQNSRLKKYA